MSDINSILKKTYLTRLRVNMNEYFNEVLDNSHENNIEISEKFDFMVDSMFDEISNDFDLCKANNKLLHKFKLKLKNEIDVYSSQMILPTNEKYIKLETPWVNRYIDLLKIEYLKGVDFKVYEQITYKPKPILKIVELKKDLPKEKFKTDNWFKVGLLFANGEMVKLKTQYKSVSTQIAKHLGNEKGYRPYISASLNEDIKKPISDKNIYSKPDKLLKIYNHCNENKLIMTDSFINAFKKQNPLE